MFYWYKRTYVGGPYLLNNIRVLVMKYFLMHCWGIMVVCQLLSGILSTFLSDLLMIQPLGINLSSRYIQNSTFRPTFTIKNYRIWEILSVIYYSSLPKKGFLTLHSKFIHHIIRLADVIFLEWVVCQSFIKSPYSISTSFIFFFSHQTSLKRQKKLVLFFLFLFLYVYGTVNIITRHYNLHKWLLMNQQTIISFSLRILCPSNQNQFHI